MRTSTFLVITALFPTLVASQPLSYTISSVAGGSTAFDFADGKSATSFLIPLFSQPAADREGNFYFSLGNRVIRVTNGVAQTYAGTGDVGYGGEGKAAASTPLNSPTVLLVDSQDRLVIFDTGNNRIRRVDANGTLNTIAGTGQQPPAALDGDHGLATAARVHPILGTYDGSGNLYFLDIPSDLSRSIRRIDTNNMITTVSRSAGVTPAGMASEGANIYLADSNPNGNSVSRLTSNGTYAAITGTKPGYGGDNLASMGASLSGPVGITCDNAGNMYIVDSGNQRVRMIRNNPPNATLASGQGIISTVAGTGVAGFGSENSLPLASPLSYPTQITLDVNGNAYISDNGSGRYRRFRPNTGFQTIAGLSLSSPLGDGGPPTQAVLAGGTGLYQDTAGNLLIAGGARVRQVSIDRSTISTIAGTGIQGNSGDGRPALQALFAFPTGAVRDSLGNTYVLDGGTLRKIGLDGSLTRILGFDGATQVEGPAAKVSIAFAVSLAIDAQDNIYICTQGMVLKLTPDGTVTRVVGLAGSGSSPLNAGDARATDLSGARGLTVDTNGNLFVADSFNQRILKVAPTGQFTTVAGTYGKLGFSGDGGAAAQALVGIPIGLASDTWGNLYFTELANRRVRKIATDGTISSIAGSPDTAPIPDGAPAVNGQFSPSIDQSIVTDPAGNVLIIDGSRVRQLTPDKLRASGVLHAALQTAGPVTPGLRILVSGTELIPPGAGNDIVQVLFDGQPSSYVNIDGDHIVSVVPGAVTGQASTQLQVTIHGAGTNLLALPVVAALPGILAIQNADGSINGDGSPATSGSTVALLVTGDGGVDPSNFSVLIGGMPAQILDASPSDSQPGVLVVAVQLSDGTTDGSPVVFAVGNASSPGITLRVQ